MKFVLYALLVLVIVVSICLIIAIIRTLMVKKKTSSYTPCKDEKRINDYASKLSKMVQVETVSVAGKPDPDKFRKLHKVLEELFPNVFANCEKIDIDGNLLVKYKGKNPDLDPIILISHLDVVSADGDWTYPPFSGEIHDGKIYGRGSGDIKSGVFSFYQAVDELIQDGYVPECDVYLGSSCTEEVGGDGAPKIVNWFKERGIKLFMLSDEGGAITEDPISGIKGNFAMVGMFEKGHGNVRLVAKGKGGHSSTPAKNTPIVRLGKLEAEIDRRSPFKAQFSPAVESMFVNFAPYCDNFLLKMVMCNLWLFKPILCKVAGKISPIIDAMLKTTICFTMQEGSQGLNVIPQAAWVNANLRYIPHQNAKESHEALKKVADKYNVELEVVPGGNDASKQLDLEGDAYRMTKETINKVFPGMGVIPYVVTGGTDSRFFDPVCDACVRFSPLNSTAEQMGRMHGIDENINADTLPTGVDYYKELIKLQETRKK